MIFSEDIFKLIKQLIRSCIRVCFRLAEIIVASCFDECWKLCDDIFIGLLDGGLRFFLFRHFVGVKSILNDLHLVVISLTNDAL